jgi:cell wall-associated NlpC family hydrolase
MRRLKTITVLALAAGVFGSSAQLTPGGVALAAAEPVDAPSNDAASTLLDPAIRLALGAAKASGTLKAIEGSLVYLGAKYETAMAAREVAEAPSQPARAPEEEGVGGGSPLPPASAGTNGTPRPPLPQGVGGSLVARAPTPEGGQAAGATATYVSGIALAPPDAPERIAGTINAANTIVGQPYVWGGGHGSWYSRGYDCSGAVSFALAGGGFLSSPLSSGQLESWGAPGPGRWLTVYASPSHAYAVIAGLRWDTVGDASGSGPRWHLAGAVPDGFVARHPPGY